VNQEQARADAIVAECYNLRALEQERNRPTPPPLWTCPCCGGGVPQDMEREHIGLCTGRRRLP
jgi:hypothetical protein